MKCWKNRVRHIVILQQFVSVLLQNISSARLLLRISSWLLYIICKLPTNGYTILVIHLQNDRPEGLFRFFLEQKNCMMSFLVLMLIFHSNSHVFSVNKCNAMTCYHYFRDKIFFIQKSKSLKKIVTLYGNNTTFVSRVTACSKLLTFSPLCIKRYYEKGKMRILIMKMQMKDPSDPFIMKMGYFHFFLELFFVFFLPYNV